MSPYTAETVLAIPAAAAAWVMLDLTGEELGELLVRILRRVGIWLVPPQTEKREPVVKGATARNRWLHWCAHEGCAPSCERAPMPWWVV